MGMIRKIAFLLLVCGVNLWAQKSPAVVTTIPEWLIPLREAVYEQKLTSAEIKPIYNEAKTASQNNAQGTALDAALSRCEYYMGRALLYEKLGEEARVHFVEGMRLGEKAVAEKPGAEAWLILTENLSQNCGIGPWTYAVKYGLDVEKFAKNALTFNSRNAAAQYIIAARWVFAPAPFNNIKKGIEMMDEIFTNADMDKDDIFNTNIAIGYAYIHQKKHSDARPWIQKALEIYPTNKYAAELLAMK